MENVPSPQLSEMHALQRLLGSSVPEGLPGLRNQEPSAAQPGGLCRHGPPLPGVPSVCEAEEDRKRALKMAAGQQVPEEEFDITDFPDRGRGRPAARPGHLDPLRLPRPSLR